MDRTTARRAMSTYELPPPIRLQAVGSGAMGSTETMGRTQKEVGRR
jgi:hypothetical protein